MIQLYVYVHSFKKIFFSIVVYHRIPFFPFPTMCVCVFFFFFFLFSKSILKEQMVSGSEHLCSLRLTKEDLVAETKQRLSKKEMEMSEI